MKWVGFLLIMSAALPAQANPCEAEARTTEQALQLPSDLLLAIGRVESGRPGADGRVAPWPWSVNAAGEGHFLGSKAEAIELVQTLQAKGIHSIDVGCFQINLLHHPDAFQSLSDAFDPARNAQAAGLFLNSLHATYTNWDQAIAAYHSANPSVGMPYLELIQAAWHGTPAVMAARVWPRLSAIQVFVPELARGLDKPGGLGLQPVSHLPASHLPRVIVPTMSPL